MNVHGSWPNHALALGLDKDAIRRSSSSSSSRGTRVPGSSSASTTAPWQEVVVDKDINLFDLMPLFRLNRGDGGYFLDKPCVVSRDPDDWDNDDVENVGVYRLQVKGPKPARASRPFPSTTSRSTRPRRGPRPGPADRDRPGQRADHHADGRYADVVRPARVQDGRRHAGRALPRRPDRKGLDVPWGSEYVLEGRILARQREIEGPFGEFPGYYSGCHQYPVIEIDRVSHRKDPIYDAVYVGRPWTELDYLQAMTTSAPIYAAAQADFPEVVAVNALYTHGLVVIVSTRPATAASPKPSVCAAHHDPRSRLRQDRHRRRRGRRPLRPQSGHVGHVGQGQPGRRHRDRAEPVRSTC